jgi:hypothetical protein
VHSPAVPADHIVQLFDTDESLARAVAAFLDAGLEDGQSLLVVATEQHWRATAAELRTLGHDAGDLTDEARLTVIDAEALLARFMRRGEPNRALFAQSVAATVTRLATAAPSGLRVYGEMVELLAQDGNYTAAAQLERLWNELRTQCPFTLLCGYSAAHFAAPDAGSALRLICCEHSRTLCERTDPLGQFLLAAEQSRTPPLSASR